MTMATAQTPTCGTDCEHPSRDMDFRVLPPPDYSHIHFLPAPPGVATRPVANSLGRNYFLADYGADIPYAFTIGAVSFGGMLYIRGDDGADSYTDGVMAGVLDCLYHI